MTYNKEAVKRWREKNKERYTEWKKEYNKKRKKENPDKAKAIRKRARIKHREKQKLKDTLIEKLIEENKVLRLELGMYQSLFKVEIEPYGCGILEKATEEDIEKAIKKYFNTNQK